MVEDQELELGGMSMLRKDTDRLYLGFCTAAFMGVE
jgi:hypothetical protein